MTDIILYGCSGKMGRNVTEAVKKRKDMQIVCGVDSYDSIELGYPVFNSLSEVEMSADVLIDFSNTSSLDSILSYSIKTKTPAVIATTGFSSEQIEKIEKASESVPIFFSFNMSLGVNLLCELSKTAAKVLGKDFNIEIIEAHHNQKVDAPSGTAIMIADAIKETDPELYTEYDRFSKKEKRGINEIGIHSIRGGTIVGEHEVIFAGNDEIIKISHSARSRMIFAEGALNAAKYIADKDNGLFKMSDLLV